MLSTDRQPWLLGGWLATVAGIVTVRVTMGANVSTASLLVALGVASAIVMGLVKRGAWRPTVAEIVRAVHTTNASRNGFRRPASLPRADAVARIWK
jgi:hypothetical protein